MKAFVMALALIGLSASLAQGLESQGSISCSSDTYKTDGTTIQFESRLISISQSADGSMTAGLWDPKVTYTDDFSYKAGESQVGRKDHLQADANYRPRKYKNTVRFDFSNLVDARTFGAFVPGDSCSIKLMIPVNAIELGKFKAAAIINCDQSGGSKTLDCTTAPRK